MESLLSLSISNSIFGAVLCAVKKRNKFISKRTVWEIIQRKTRKTDWSLGFFFYTDNLAAPLFTFLTLSATVEN